MAHAAGRTPDDYVVATGETHSVREFCEAAFACADIKLSWKGKGLDEKGIGNDGRALVELDPRYLRPTEVEHLMGDPSKAKAKLGWKPRVGFERLVEMMMESDLALASREARETG